MVWASVREIVEALGASSVAAKKRLSLGPPRSLMQAKTRSVDELHRMLFERRPVSASVSASERSMSEMKSKSTLRSSNLPARSQRRI